MISHAHQREPYCPTSRLADGSSTEHNRHLMDNEHIARYPICNAALTLLRNKKQELVDLPTLIMGQQQAFLQQMEKGVY